ncbi:hypothetical protein B0H14DRAFT_3751742 [Mycena olivaceomarginata]|nr:hypothetical protein B0H14DRAFT_3751742 [Mycena olivaceomarginata]
MAKSGAPKRPARGLAAPTSPQNSDSKAKAKTRQIDNGRAVQLPLRNPCLPPPCQRAPANRLRRSQRNWRDGRMAVVRMKSRKNRTIMRRDEDEEEDEENEDEEDEEGGRGGRGGGGCAPPEAPAQTVYRCQYLRLHAERTRKKAEGSNGLSFRYHEGRVNRSTASIREKATRKDHSFMTTSYSSMIQAAPQMQRSDYQYSSRRSQAAEKAKTNGKKSKISTENDISPINAGLSMPKSACCVQNIPVMQMMAVDYCWVSGEDKKHIPLGNPHFNLWAAALRGPPTRTRPPNHAIFSGNGNSGLAPQSILQRRIAANQSAASNSAPTINNHFSFPDALMDLLRPAPASAAAVPPATPTTQTHDGQMLLPPTMNVGIAMSIDVFCATYDLDPSIADKLATNGYKKASAFRFIELKDLVSIKLRQAVREWASPG